MPRLKIKDETGSLRFIQAGKGENLLAVLTQRGFRIYAPCGGKGTCGKCRIWTLEQGTVFACQSTVSQDTEIVLPSALEASILDHQHRFTHTYPVNPGPSLELSPTPFGVAVDIGTTTIVLYFFDFSKSSLLHISSLLNPQQNYGADVISRINHCILHEGGLGTLHLELINAINREIKQFLSDHGRRLPVLR